MGESRRHTGYTGHFSLIGTYYVSDGQINSVRIGHRRRIPADALTAYADRLAAEQNAA